MIDTRLTRAAQVCLSLWMLGCDGPTSRSRFAVPMTPVAPTPVPSPPTPPPRPFPATFEFTPIEVDEVITRTISNPPPCLDWPVWPCQYFRITAPSTGTLVILLTFDSSTQGQQGVDISAGDLGPDGGEHWAEFGSATQTRLTLPVTAGRTYQIALWYTYEKLHYELRTSLKPPPA